MSQTVDQRVVRMKFDNTQFENGAKTTLGTLEKLKNALSFKDASESLNELENAGKSFDFSGVSEAVNSVSVRFGALEIAAITALQNITNYALGKFKNVWTNTIGQIMSGGKSRSLNLEQARFSMSGLFSGMYDDAKVVGEKVEEVMGDGGPVQEAVAGTAYGLDAAALAASNLLATGIDIKDLEKPLKTISGLAAQTGRSYEMMADVVNDAYAKTYVSGMEISRLQESGINAIAELQKYYKELKGISYSADEISDMIRKKQISAKDFTEALYHYYENAARANDTYTGSLSNLKAALSRVGQKFYDPHIKNMTKIFNAFRIAVNALNANALGPLFDILNKVDSMFTKVAVSIADFISNYYGFNKKIHSDLGRSSEVIGWMRTGLLDIINIFKTIVKIFEKPVNNIASSFKTWAVHLIRIKDIWANFIGSISYGEERWYSRIDSIKTIGTNLSGFFSAVSKMVGIAIKNTLRLIEGLSSVLTTKIFPLFQKFISIGALILTPFIEAFSFLNRNEAFNFLYNVLMKLGDLIYGVFNPLLDAMYLKITKNKKQIKEFADNVATFVNNLFRNLSKMISGEKDFSTIGETLLNVLRNIINIITIVSEKIKSFIDSVKEVGPLVKFQNVLNKLYNVLAPYGEAIKGFAKNLKENLGFNNVADFAGLLALVVDGGILYKLFNWFIKMRAMLNRDSKSIGGLISQIWLEGKQTVFGDILQSINNVKNLLLEMQREIKSKIIRSIAESLLMLAGAFLILSMIDSQKLTEVMFVLSAMLIELFVSLQAFFKIMDSQSLKSVAKVYLVEAFFTTLAKALLIMSVALKIISTIEPDRMKSSVLGLIAVTASLGILVSVLVGINAMYGGSLRACTKGLISLSIAIGILAGVVKILGSMDQGQLERGINALSNIILIVGLFMSVIMIISSYTTFSGGNMFKGIISMAVSMLILAKVVEKLGSLDPGVLTTGIEALGAILIILGMFMTLSDGYGSASVSASLIAIAVSMLIFQKAIEKLGSIPFENLMLGLGSMLAILMAIVGMFTLMPKDARVLSTAAALLIMGIALNTFALALKVIASIPFTSLIKSIGALVIVLGIFAGLAFLFGSTWQVLLPGVGIMVALAGAMALFGAGMLALAVAITIISPLIVAFAGNIILAARAILRGIADLGSDLVLGISTIIVAVLKAIQASIPELLKTLTVLLDAFLTFFEDNISRLIETGYKLVMGILTGLTEKMPEIVNAGFSVLIAFIDGLAAALMERGDELGAAAGRLIEGLLMGLWDAAVGLFKEVDEFARQMIEEHFGVDLSETSLVEIGKNLIQGLWNGIKEKTRELLDSLWDWGKVLVGRMGEAVGVKSPSWMFKEIGEYCMDGLAIGLSKAMEPMNAVDEAGDNILSAFRSTMSNIESVINSDMNMQPTVTPVLDLSQIQNGVSTMNGMFGLTNGMTASISGKLSALRTRQAENDLKAIAETIKKSNDAPTVNMTVYGAQGQDVRELAEIVSNRIQHQLSRREMALG